MATKIRKLIDDNGDTIAPVISTKTVISKTGESIDYILEEKVEFKDASGFPSIPKFPKELGTTVDLSKVDIFGNLKNTRETANSYVISKPGNYCFPLVYGCAIKDGVINTESYTNNKERYSADFVNYKGNQIAHSYIEKDTGETVSSIEVLISDENGGISDLGIALFSGNSVRSVYFTVTNIPETGANYVIGAKDSNDNIMWSWHIWLWDQVNHPLSNVEIENYSGNTYRTLNYNLGTKLDSDLVHMKNWYYQWGRKDPMLLPESYNSYNNHESFGSTNFFIITTPASSVSDTIKNPCTFYTVDTQNWGYNYNWVQLNYFLNYWDATCNSTGFNEKTITKTIYDPCPPGYTIPNARVFTGFTTTGNNTSTSSEFNVNGSWKTGWNFKDASDNSVFFPASGYRGNDSGAVYYVGSDGYYWSAGASSVYNASSLLFDSGGVDPLVSYGRADGFSVRPVFAS